MSSPEETGSSATDSRVPLGPVAPSTPLSLKDALTQHLPDGFRCRVRYIQTPPKQCEPLFSPPFGREPEKTQLASHFLTISARAPTKNNEGPDILAVGVEVLVYSTNRLTTMFVSKADTSGHIPSSEPTRTKEKPLSRVKPACTTFVQWLAEKELRRHPQRKLVISLFARAQSQYLFPGSADNTGKHVLDDRQLIKWWVRVLDPVFDLEDSWNFIPVMPAFTCNGFITVPGLDTTELRPYFPPSNAFMGEHARWRSGHPLRDLAMNRGISSSAATRCLLPRFPDDPKARFMQDLDDEMGLAQDASTTTSPSKRKDEKWKSIADLDRFWEAMEFRQECSSGRVVGFLWLVFTPESDSESDTANEPSVETLEVGGSDSQLSAISVTSGDPMSVDGAGSRAINGSPKKHKRKPLSGPVISRQPRLKGGSSLLTATSAELSGMLNVPRGDGLLLTKDAYDKAIQTLLYLDFGELDAAAQSTLKWENEVKGMCGLSSDWAVEVVGKWVKDAEEKAELAAQKAADGVPPTGPATYALKVKPTRKRKAAAPSEGTAATGTSDVDPPAAINVLAGTAIRKKAKPNPPPPAP